MSEPRISFSPGMIIASIAGSLCLVWWIQRPAGGQSRVAVPNPPSAEELELIDLREDIAWGFAEIRERTRGHPRECRIQQDEFRELNATMIQRERELSLALLEAEAATSANEEPTEVEDRSQMSPVRREIAIIGDQIRNGMEEATIASDDPRDRRANVGTMLHMLEPAIKREGELLAALAEVEQTITAAEESADEAPLDAPVDEATRLRSQLAAGMAAAMSGETDPRERRMRLDAFMAGNAALFELEAELSANRDPLTESKPESERTDQSEPD